MIRIARWAALLLVLTTLVAAPMQSAHAQDDAQAQLDATAAAMLALKSFHFQLDTTAGTTSYQDAFELKEVSGDVVRLQLVEAKLGADLTPVFKSSLGCPQDGANPMQCANWTPTQPVMQSADTFNQWYHTVDGVNQKFTKQLQLTETAPGSGIFVYDSSAFFPLGPTEGFGITPPGNAPMQNFLFTTEIHLNFEYKAGQKFTFRGDDDLWIFVNGQLALDLGSMHSAVQGTIDFDAQAAALNIVPGQSYGMDIFQAERHTTGSNFRFETNISCFTPGPVPK